ncbi:hypothetical protein WJX79_000526 [Trebouxia sp. C0005]|nr:MAG: U5 small nuclear ribonucleo 40 kDa -like [Trebouxia sp. A1-2]
MATEGPKRPLPDDSTEESSIVLKKQKTESAVSTAQQLPGVPRRTSSLLAPIMLLTGHAGEVFGVKFSPDGTVLASCSHDKHLYLWNMHGECDNYMVLKGHKNAVLDVHWTNDGEKLLSASPDKTVRVWDTSTGQQTKKMTEHDNFVNSCSPLRRGPPLLCSGSDDGNVKVWDMRVKRSVQTFTGKYQVLAVAFSDAGDQVYSGGLDNNITVWDLRKGEQSMSLTGHTDSITGLSLNPDGTHLLSNAVDNSLRVWDMRPYAPANRCEKIFTGHQHNYERNLLRCSWSLDSSKVTAGSADRMVYIWNASSRQIEYKLPGHLGSVNDAVFHPKEPIVASASSDKQIYLGELSKWS